MEIVALCVAIMGLAMSAYNFFYEKHKNRFKVEVGLLDVIVPRNANPMLDILYLQIVNKSREPVTITALETSCNREKMNYGNVRKELIRVSDHSRGTCDFWHSDILPIRIEGLGAVRALVIADNGKRNFNHTDIFDMRVCTNKGVAGFSFKVSDATEHFGDEKVLLQCRAPDLRY